MKLRIGGSLLGGDCLACEIDPRRRGHEANLGGLDRNIRREPGLAAGFEDDRVQCEAFLVHDEWLVLQLAERHWAIDADRQCRSITWSPRTSRAAIWFACCQSNEPRPLPIHIVYPSRAALTRRSRVVIDWLLTVVIVGNSIRLVSGVELGDALG